MANIFKAYDIRWIYPSEINEEQVYKIAFSFVEFLDLKWKTVVVWKDIRKSSNSLIKQIIAWLTDAWANVINIWLATTPMVYFANGKLKASGSIILTASHNPKEFNWMKLCREKAIPISGDTWIKEIEKLVLTSPLAPLLWEEKGTKWKVKNNEKIKKEYIDFIKSFAKFWDKKIKIVIDSANAMWILEKEVLEELDIEIINLYDELDWNFPNHEGNPLDYSTLVDLQKKVLETKAQLWVSFDWDADRVGFVDENWQIIEPDFIWAIIAREILISEKTQKKVNILYDLRTSLTVPEIIKKYNWNPIESRVWHAFIKNIMREKDVIFASELSGHYYFKDNYYTESSSLAVIYILNLITNSSEKISEIVEKLKKFYKIPETNFTVKNKQKILEKIEKKYFLDEKKENIKILKIDWLKISFEDWWFSLRASNTENVLRLNLEAKTEELKEEKLKELEKEIK